IFLRSASSSYSATAFGRLGCRPHPHASALSRARGGPLANSETHPHCPARERSDMATPDKESPSRLDEWSPRLIKSRLYNRILADIIIGVYAPGEQLDENVLAGRYGGGLAGIREALARLSLEGLVVRKARVGTSVAPLDLTGAREAFEARCLVEVHCAGLAAQRATSEEIAAIRATLDDGET